jgi:uncharacterized RDD family membrane protein YckC
LTPADPAGPGTTGGTAAAHVVPAAPVARPAGFWRRTGALVYDTLLLLGIWFTTAGIAVTVNGGAAVQGVWFSALLLGVAFAFFGWFWTRHGRTLGMQAWHLHLRRADGAALDWPAAARRFAAACCTLPLAGLGHLWMLLDARHRTLPDILSRTCVLHVPKAR